MKIDIYKIWYKLNHTIITAVLVTVGCVFGYGIESLLMVSGFWAGREHSQAEYRYMSAHGINRSSLKWYDGFKLESWNYDSFVNDLVIPIVVGSLLIVVSYVMA